MFFRVCPRKSGNFAGNSLAKHIVIYATICVNGLPTETVDVLKQALQTQFTELLQFGLEHPKRWARMRP